MNRLERPTRFLMELSLLLDKYEMKLTSEVGDCVVRVESDSNERILWDSDSLDLGIDPTSDDVLREAWRLN